LNPLPGSAIVGRVHRDVLHQDALVFLLFTTLFGGIGLFLLGMVLLTDSLKSLAGDALRRTLVRFTGRPVKAFASGALVTLLVQSSSATTVALIGFVSAGLITFPQAVGVVFGATLGTTGTGWIVSVLGLKVSVGLYALPLVGLGMFVKLLGRRRWKHVGLALAGFGLIFVGIDTLQQGMQGLSGRIDLAALSAPGLFNDLILLAIGVALTVVMQSSSAATATTLTALHTNSITFEQACSLVIGASIGTTVTSALAAIGASVSAKRTALAHVLFNLATGLIAVVTLPLFLRGIGWAQGHLGLEPGAISLAAFHTSFVLVGVLVFLPFTTPFAQWIERLLPEKGPRPTRHLDHSLLAVPVVALEATRRALTDTACELFHVTRTDLQEPQAEVDSARQLQIQQALEQTQQFLARIPPLSEGEPISQRRVAQMHAVDHLLRMLSHLPPPTGVRTALAHERLQPLLVRCRNLLAIAEAGLRGQAPSDWLTDVEQQSRELADSRRQDRPDVFRQAAVDGWDPPQALALLDAMRWLDRIGYHTWRTSHYLGDTGVSDPSGEEARTPPQE
jgi:phosphate:Na+ symporter